jgi:hypothetical protein
LVFAKYQKDIESIDSSQKVQEVARKFFKSAKSDVRAVIAKVQSEIGKRVLDPKVVISSLKEFWTPLARGRPLLASLQGLASLQELFPFLCYNSSVEARKLEDYLRVFQKELDAASDIKSYATERYDAIDRDLAFLSKKSREKSLEEAFASIWGRVWTAAESANTVQPLINIARESLKLFPVGIQELYLRDLSFSKDVGDLKARVQGYLNDSIAAQYTAGMKSTQATGAGSQGSPKIIDLQRSSRLTGFMKYVSGSQEMQMHRLYKFLLETCAKFQDCNSNFQVPLGSMLEFSQEGSAVYTDGFGQRAGSTSLEKGQHIKDLLSWMALANTKRDCDTVEKELEFQHLADSSPIGFFDLVSGCNLSEFFLSQYHDLDLPKKQGVFFHLGMVAFLDLLIGNQDRLIRLSPFQGETFLEAFESEGGSTNIANVMISPEKGTFHLIDNVLGDGIMNAHSKTIEDQEEERASYDAFLASYDAFLKELLNSEDLQAKLSSRFLKSLEQSFIEMREDLDFEDIQKLKAQGKDLPQDLLLKDLEINRTFIENSVRDGIVHMRNYITDVMIPGWKSAAADELKNTLDPILIQMIDNRFEMCELASV